MRTPRSVVLLVALLGAFTPLVLLSPAQEAAKEKPAAPQAGEMVPRLFTLQESDLTLKGALTALQKQTGNRVADRRQAKSEVRLKLNLTKKTFWEALDTIARDADARVSLFEEDGMLALVDGPYRELPVSYSGLFRTSIKRIDVTRVLEADAHFATVFLEVAWEPQFRPFFVETRGDSLSVQDDKGTTLESGEEARGQASVDARNGIELRVRIPAPRRSAQRIGLLKGTLTATGAGKMIDFTFDELAKVARPLKPESLKKTQEGITVQVRRFETDDVGGKLWTVEMLLDYPGSGPKFESFQSWFIQNEIYLLKEKQGIEIRVPHNAGLETGDASETKAIISYRFQDEPDKKIFLGEPGDWKLVYRTPGKFVDLPVPFEFKDVPLP